MIDNATGQKKPWEVEDMPEDNKGEQEEQLKAILLEKLKKKVSDLDSIKNILDKGMPNLICFFTFLNLRGAVSVLTDLAVEANLDFNGENNLDYYQRKLAEANDIQNEILKLFKQGKGEEKLKWATSENPYVLENMQLKAEQTTQISNEGQTGTVTLQPNELNELVRELRSAISLIQENANVIANSKERQKKTEGNNNSNFNEAVNTDKLIEEYEANGCHLTKEMCKRYKDDYDITMNGLRNRLIKAGKWKGRQ
jgi:hypothetical protein